MKLPRRTPCFLEASLSRAAMLSRHHLPEPDVLLGELCPLGLACLPGDVSQEAITPNRIPVLEVSLRTVLRL